MPSKLTTALTMMTALSSGINLSGSDYHQDRGFDNSRPGTLTEKQKKERKRKNKQRKNAKRKNRK